MAHTVKNLPAMQETWVQSLGPEDLLEKGIVIPLHEGLTVRTNTRRSHKS